MKARFQYCALSFISLIIFSTLSLQAHAGGVALGATRIIYPQGAKQISLPLTNSSDEMNYLIQSWVANPDGTKSQDFIITPPLFVIHPHKENTLRIMYTGPDLPGDRESVFYLNSKAIPAIDKSKLASNTLQIATQSVIKLFVRPAHLATLAVDAPKTLTCQQANGKVTINNPSPYYVTLVQFYVGSEKLPNSMVPPKNSLTETVPGGQNGKVSFKTINDFGANTPTQFCQG